MNSDTARLTANKARVRYLNSVHGVFLRPGRRQAGQDLLPLACLNSLTLLGAELEGRAYGGGMLKLEPSEADSLPVPSLELVQRVAGALRNIRPQLGAHLRQGRLLDAVKMVDRIVLRTGSGLSHADIELFRGGREVMYARRKARGKASA